MLAGYNFIGAFKFSDALTQKKKNLAPAKSYSWSTADSFVKDTRQRGEAAEPHAWGLDAMLIINLVQL